MSQLHRLVHETLDLELVAAELARRARDLFCRNVFIDGESAVSLHDKMLPFQRRDFAALDPAWSRLVLNTQHPAVRSTRAYLERPRGHSKTTDTAVQLAWALLAAQRPLRGLAAAADFDQARLIQDALKRFIDANGHLRSPLKFIENSVRNIATGSILKIISSDVRGSWGELPDFVVCDELCHWKSPDLWHSLLSSAAKRPESILIVLSNAGIGRGWQWEAREAARNNPRWYFSSLDGPQAPWITEESLAEQQRLLPPAVFARLWLNQWQHSDGEFVSLAEAQACSDESLASRTQGEPGVDYVASIDYAEKRDLTVGCVCHLEGRTVIVDRMNVVRPATNCTTPVRWVSNWIHSIAADFPGVQFILDAYQLVSVIQSLEATYPISRFEFRAGQGNFELAYTLRQLILERLVRWFPGCGVIPGEEQATPPDDLEHELASLLVREMGGGRFRFDHRADGQRHDDRAFALAVACHALVGRPSHDPLIWDVTPPERAGLLG